MGNMIRRAEEWMLESRRQQLEDFVYMLNEGPDLKVNKNIVMFTSLASSDNLAKHYEKRKMEAGDCAAEWIKSLVDKLGALTSAPELAGLGALAIAVLIDICCLSPPGEDTKEALRCVFAEEKASEVWDQIDECLKRCVIHNSDELVNDIKRVECQLSIALTRLNNSMVRDGHMSSEALRAWVNGAAFHIQILIHLVRLGGIQTCNPVERLISTYQSDLGLLFEKHKEVIEGKCHVSMTVGAMSVVSKYLVDEDSEKHAMDPDGTYEEYFEAYYDRRYSTQKHEIQQYFSDVRQNLQELVHQRGSFIVT